MALKPALTLKMGQQLRMTPQLQQAIRLLQLSTAELELEIQQVKQGRCWRKPGYNRNEPNSLQAASKP